MPQSDIFEDYFCSRREENFEKSKKLSESEHRWPFTREFGRKVSFTEMLGTVKADFIGQAAIL